LLFDQFLIKVYKTGPQSARAELNKRLLITNKALAVHVDDVEDLIPEPEPERRIATQADPKRTRPPQDRGSTQHIDGTGN